VTSTFLLWFLSRLTEVAGEVKPVDYEVKPVDYEVKPVDAVKVPAPDYSQVVDPNKIFDLWKVSQPKLT
jgi:hypothetical protein